MSNSRISKLAVVTLLSVVFTSLLGYSHTQTAVADVSCTPVKAVFARGSGQKLNEKENERFKKQFESYLSTSMLSYYELGTTPQDGTTYPAVNVSDWRNGNSLGAYVTAGQGNDYGKSVNDGVYELNHYLREVNSTCPSTLFVLAGYSQGAQVIGQALPTLDSSLQSKIVYNGLFGDPKLNLPEGRGIYPDACRGKNLSPYRREIANCNVDNGVLGARDPYLTNNFGSKTGLWCYGHDFICGSSKAFWDNDGHGTYAGDGKAIDQAVKEAVAKLKAALPSDTASEITPEDTSTVDTAVDVVYVIDTTGSMGSQIQSAVQFASRSAADVMTKHGRAALVAYKDQGDAYTAKVVSDFSSDIAQFQAGLDTLEASGGGDEPEALLHALMLSFNTLSWKNGVTKAAVVLTDASYHDPDTVDGTTVSDVVRRSLEIDPVNIYPIVSNYNSGQYTTLADQTAGQVITDNGDTLGALTTAFAKIKTRPVVSLPLEAYSAQTGQELSFDATATTPTGVSITSYDWDFNGDGIFDQTTTSPSVTYTYPDTFSGYIQVRANASNDTVGSASAQVEVGTTIPVATSEAPHNLTVKVIKTSDHKSTVTLSWAIPATLPDHYVLTVNGVGVGTLAATRTSIEIRDLDRTIDNQLGLIGATSDSIEGDASSIILEKEAPVEQPPAPQPPAKSLLELLQEYICNLLRRYVPWLFG